MWFSLKFVPKGPIDNMSALLQVMALRWTGEKPLPETMLTQSINAYMQHLGRWVNGLSTIQRRMIYNPIPIYGQWKPIESWWRHQMETFSVLLAICAGNSLVTREFPTQRPVTQSFDVFFDLRPNKRLSKQSRGWWFETLPCSLWCHCNADTEYTVHQYSDVFIQDNAPTVWSAESPPSWFRQWWVKTLRHRQNGHQFADNISKFISLYENCCILIKI